MTDWDDKAREALGALGGSGVRVEAILALGRKMANARAEEIARQFDALARTPDQDHGADAQWEEAARIARGLPVKTREYVPESRGYALRTIEAGEEFLLGLDSSGRPILVDQRTGKPVTSHEKPKPKTREAVLEQALREIADIDTPYRAVEDIARRALEWKP